MSSTIRASIIICRPRSADLDRLLQADLHLQAAAVPDRLPAARWSFFVGGHQPDLSVLDPHRGDRPDAALVRGGDEHAEPPPRPPRDQPALSRHELCRRVHRLGQDVRHLHRPSATTKSPRYGIVKNLGSFNLVWAAFHEWIGIAQGRVGRADGCKAKWNYMIKPPGWSHDGSRETSESIKALWEQRERERRSGRSRHRRRRGRIGRRRRSGPPQRGRPLLGSVARGGRAQHRADHPRPRLHGQADAQDQLGVSKPCRKRG